MLFVWISFASNIISYHLISINLTSQQTCGFQHIEEFEGQWRNAKKLKSMEMASQIPGLIVFHGCGSVHK